jgi:hypothetical protein
MRFACLVASLCLSVSAIAADHKGDPHLAKIYAEALPYKNTTFSTLINWTSITKKERVERVVRYDPAKIEAQRWTYISRNGKPPEQKKLENFMKSVKGDSPNGYGLVVEFLEDSNWTAGPKTDSGIVYTMVPDDKAKVNINGINMAKFLTVKMYVDGSDRPYVKSITMVAPKAFSPRTGAKVNALSVSYTFARRAEGDIIAQSETNKADFKILMFGNQVDDTRVYKEVGKRVPAPTVTP